MKLLSPSLRENSRPSLRIRRNYDEKLAHLIEAGMDITLIPSRFEPAALSAMYGCKYGALRLREQPAAFRRSLRITIQPTDSGYGFLCYEYSTEAFWDAIKRARKSSVIGMCGPR